ncbi:MAG: tetratricopeptide repeat protein [Acidimicrobiia bacterium]|nr:tetratricopeptide repeat protein [Acidimicrobiia bacterium]
MPQLRRAKRVDEREFWLSSLDDLDEELRAGDLEPEDHEVLARSYTRKAAQVLRGNDDVEASDELEPSIVEQWARKRRNGFWVLGFLVFGVVAGVFLANAVGSRHSGDTITGNDAVTSVPGLLNNAEESFAQGNYAEAIAIYDRVLERSPAHPTALAYKGWLLSLEGQEAKALDVLADAVAAAPSYPDARAFRAIVLFRTGDCAGAAVHLRAFDEADPPDFLVELLVVQGLRTRIARCRILQAADDPFVSLSDLGLTVNDAVAGALIVFDPTDPAGGSPVLALRVLQAVLDEQPNNAAALTFSGVILVQTGLEEQITEGIRRINLAVEAAPNYPQARLWRAWVFIGLDQMEQARSDLEHLMTLNPSAEITRLVNELQARLG